MVLLMRNKANVIVTFFTHDGGFGYRAIAEWIDFDSNAKSAMILVDDWIPKVIETHEYEQFLEHVETAIITSMVGWCRYAGNNNT